MKRIVRHTLLIFFEPKWYITNQKVKYLNFFCKTINMNTEVILLKKLLKEIILIKKELIDIKKKL
jgi:hypothetical protein